jgi:hypothetical protein
MIDRLVLTYLNLLQLTTISHDRTSVISKESVTEKRFTYFYTATNLYCLVSTHHDLLTIIPFAQ